MKQTTRRVAVSSAILTTLVAALLQVSRPAELPAHEGEECGSERDDVCSTIETRTCRFWIFFCTTKTETLYYSDVYH